VNSRLSIMIVTDAWRPQVNGVARTMEMLDVELRALGVRAQFLTPDGYRQLPMPGYPEIRIAMASPWSVSRAIEQARPDAVHIATEGPLGILARIHCRRVGRLFTTCYHTRYPEYVAARTRAPLALTYAALRRFHNGAEATMVSSNALKAELAARGFRNLVVWRRGVETNLFSSAQPAALDLPRPIFLNVGRLATDKNVDAFLSLDLPGSKVVIGDGPDRARLQAAYPDAHFLGQKFGRELASLYAAADVFVFPSMTDTYGLVMLEALAAGAPVAAFDVTGPREVIGESGCGILSSDLREATLKALELNRDRCRAYGAMHTIRGSAEHFLDIVMTAVGAGGDETVAAVRRFSALAARHGLGSAKSVSGVIGGAIPDAPRSS
jgi:glycosyltransferase involved in cell wall biosynthesis